MFTFDRLFFFFLYGVISCEYFCRGCLIYWLYFEFIVGDKLRFGIIWGENEKGKFVFWEGRRLVDLDFLVLGFFRILFIIFWSWFLVYCVGLKEKLFLGDFGLGEMGFRCFNVVLLG